MFSCTRHERAASHQSNSPGIVQRAPLPEGQGGRGQWRRGELSHMPKRRAQFTQPECARVLRAARQEGTPAVVIRTVTPVMPPPHVPASPLALYTLVEVARIFRVSKRTMQEYVRRYPFYRVGNRKLFTRSDINSLYKALKCPSGSSEEQAVHTGTCTAPSEASLFARPQELLTAKPPKRSGRGGSGKSSRVVCLEQRRRLPSSGQP